MAYTYSCHRASGVSHSACHFIAYRFLEEHGLRKDEAQSWIFEVADGKFHNRLWIDTYISGLWESPSGAVYITGEDLIERIAPRSAGGGSSTFEPDTIVSGVWGLTDDFVVAWGGDRDSGAGISDHSVPS